MAHTPFSIYINHLNCLLFLVRPLCTTVVMVTRRRRHFVVTTITRLGHRCCRCRCRWLCRHCLRLTRSRRWTGFTTRYIWESITSWFRSESNYFLSELFNISRKRGLQKKQSSVDTSCTRIVSPKWGDQQNNCECNGPRLVSVTEWFG